MPTVVLVVDDVPQIVALVTETLRKAGYEVIGANSGPEGMAVIHSRKIDVLVTDLVMPDISGPELVQHAWTFAPDLPVVLMTGYSLADGIPCEMLSRALVVTKPFVPMAMVDAVSQAVGGRKRPQSEPVREHPKVDYL